MKNIGYDGSGENSKIETVREDFDVNLEIPITFIKDIDLHFYKKFLQYFTRKKTFGSKVIDNFQRFLK